MEALYNPPMTDKEKTVCKRINRIYKRNESTLQIRKSGGWGMFKNVGRFYIFDVNRNLITNQDVDPEECLKKLGRE